MLIENSFAVPLPPAQAWPLLLDIEAMAKCVPGARLTERVDATTYKGAMGMRLGPVQVEFAGKLMLVDIDPVSRTATAKASAVEAKGRGNAASTTKFRMEERDGGSVVHTSTDLQLSGAIAQYGRGVGVINAVAGELLDRFSTNLASTLAERGGSTAGTSKPAAPPAQGGFLAGVAFFWRVLMRMIRGGGNGPSAA